VSQTFLFPQIAYFHSASRLYESPAVVCDLQREFSFTDAGVGEKVIVFPRDNIEPEMQF